MQSEDASSQMPFYLGLAVGVLTLCGAYVMLTKNKNNQKVTVNDLTNNETSNSPQETIKRNSSRSPNDQILNHEAIRAEIDANGPYERTLQGTLQPESFLRLKKIINKHTYLAFVPIKEKFRGERMEAMMKKDDQTYLNII